MARTSIDAIERGLLAGYRVHAASRKPGLAQEQLRMHLRKDL